MSSAQLTDEQENAKAEKWPCSTASHIYLYSATHKLARTGRYLANLLANRNRRITRPGGILRECCPPQSVNIPQLAHGTLAGGALRLPSHAARTLAWHARRPFRLVCPGAHGATTNGGESPPRGKRRGVPLRATHCLRGRYLLSYHTLRVSQTIPSSRYGTSNTLNAELGNPNPTPHPSSPGITKHGLLTLTYLRRAAKDVAYVDHQLRDACAAKVAPPHVAVMYGAHCARGAPTLAARSCSPV